MSTHLNVHEWLLNSNFSDFGEPSPASNSAQDLRPFFLDTSTLYDALPGLESDVQKAAVTLLQRGKCNSSITLRADKDSHEQLQGR